MNNPANDPLPWVTSALDRAGAFDLQTDEVYDYRSQSYSDKTRVSNTAAAALLDVLTNTVAALHDDAKAYRVVLNQSTATAGTLLERRIVEVGSKPMNDDDLTDGQKAAVMMGLALHEVGHIRYSRAYKGAITRLFGAGKVTGAISTLSNLAADCHDEAEAMDAFPGLAPTIAVTLWWVGGKGQSVPRPLDLNESVQARVNAAIAATRYAWQVDWDSDDEGAAWLDWWVDWGKRARNAGKPKVHAEIVHEAILKVRDFTPTPPDTEPEPPEQPQPQGTPEAGDGQPDMSDDEQGSEPSPDGDDGQESDPGQTIPGDGDADDEGDEAEGTPEGAGDEASESGAETTEGTPTGEQGGLGDENPIEDYMADLDKAMDEDLPTDDPCVKDAAKDDQNDTMLQQGADHVSRGKREGMRTRKYHHSSSQWGAYKQGRTVASIPRKGKRWVYDT